MKCLREKKHSFTLVEVAVAALVFIIAAVGILFLYINSTQLTTLSLRSTEAVFSAQKMVEAIRNYNFVDVYNDFSDYIFDPQGFSAGEAKGRVYVTNEGGRDDLLRVNIVICFKSGQRVIGEDLDLDGNLDSGEDKNGNGVLDSPAEITTLLTARY